MPAFAAASGRRVGAKRAEHAKAHKQGKAKVDQEIEKRILEHFDQFDKDKSGKLDCKELEAVMVLLNDNEPIAPGDVDKVLKAADKNLDGQIEKSEFTNAITAWYTACEEEAAGGGEKQSSGCCVVS
eukprot:TRINITY_DN4631_c0_g1_i1.p1 TRINITY_DN4631_c0_g1~~TRINITY_DN4631_c0_g1_i1.p1  ORF type:complete len:127 (+),score=41.82 TRINITY_DN4631_c0_g1_i1:71-451(+)